jgi:cytochrome c peroxidase
MHNGSLRTLREVVDFYDQGGIKNDNLSIHIKPLNLTEEEKDNLIEFMQSLTGENPLSAGKKQSLGIN